MKRPLLVQGTVRMRREGHELSVRCDGDLIRIESPRLWDLKAWVDALGDSRAKRPHPRGKSEGGESTESPEGEATERRVSWRGEARGPLAAVDAWVRKAQLRVEVRIGGRTIARLGGAAKPTRTSRMLGLSPMEVEAGPLVWSLFKWWG